MVKWLSKVSVPRVKVAEVPLEVLDKLDLAMTEYEKYKKSQIDRTQKLINKQRRHFKK